MKREREREREKEGLKATRTDKQKSIGRYY